MDSRFTVQCTGRLNVFVVILLSASLAGCCERTHQVSGTVRLRGEVLAEGVIQFYTPGDTPLPVAGAAIRNGSYDVPSKHGLPPGTYLVRISARKWSPNPSEDPPNPFRSEESVPEKYNVRSTLTIQLGGSERKFDFELD